MLQRWNDDILCAIFECLAPASEPFSVDDSPGLTALARCARAGKALSEPAIGVLWRQIESLSILLAVLSAFRRLEAKEENLRIYGLEDDVVEKECDRMRYYAARVRRLTHRADLSRIHPAVFAALHRHLKGKPFLPRLQAFHWSQRTPADILEIIPLIPPSLRELYISGIGSESVTSLPPIDHVFDKFVHTLSSLAPSLESLTLSGNIQSSSIVCLGALRHLKSLSIINFAHHGFGSGYLPVLRSCAGFDLREFGINLNLIDEASLTDVDITGFHSLRSLRVHGTLSLVTRFLSHVSSSELTAFGAFVPRPDRYEDYNVCLSVLCTRFASSLRTVRLSGSWTGNMASLARPLDVLAPLLALRQLEDVCILSGTGVALSLTAADALAFAKAWPCLRDFRLLYQPVPTGLHIDALSAFAVHCPRLHTLWIVSVDLRGVGERSLDACPRASSSHGLRNIWLPGDVEVADAYKAAQFIDVMFPHVDTRPVEYPWHLSRNSNRWEKVLASLKEVKSARLHAARS